MALLTTPRTAPGISLRSHNHHHHHHQPEVISTLYPLINTALQFQQLVSSAAFHLVVRTFFAASLIATTTLLASKAIAWRSLVIARILAAQATSLAGYLTRTLWDCKRSRRFRKGLEYEFYVLLFGPGGRALFLMLFWPGWPMLAALAWAIWQFTG
ncbi:hypothetical protein N656DRAFT_829049 [Canariomyces notabilis]|uniref:Uncharacterized protein n=1 Tax=Canariomyces notabilis TaxID=2074819 RepID=A0AAN6TE51_9PEZI|nr:hypothetical protein N656DRAFT_829049 [Canariomyces arenarius]